MANSRFRNKNLNSIQGMIHRPLAYGIAIVVAAVLSVGIFAGAQFLAAKKDNVVGAQVSAASNEQSPPDAGISQLKKTSESFRAVAKAVGPAVVNIKSTKGGPKAKPPKGMRRGRPGRPVPPEDEDGGGPGGPRDPFFDFFERFGGGGHPFMQPGPDVPQTSLGSGVIIDKKGYVVTNNHVVEDASEILVSLAGDKTDLKAKVIGTDEKTDLALLKVETSKDLPVAEWADSDTVEVGDWAIAIGSPFDLRQTVTVGIVSAKGRSSNVLGGSDYVGDFIQTDAAINPGNSGGPLCTLDGKIMGVNTAIYTRSGGYMGIGFAIPSNLAKDIVNKLRTEGKIVRGWLGVQIANLDEQGAKKVGVSSGVRIAEVMPDSPAQKAGLQAGDVVIELEGKPLKDTTQLRQFIMGLKPGQTVKLKVHSYNDQSNRNVSVKIGELPQEQAVAKSGGQEDAGPDKLGVVVAEIKGKEGVVVQGVDMGGIAQMSGIEEGDEITRVNRQATKSVAAYKKATSSGKYFELEIKRQGRKLFLTVMLPE